MKKKKGNIFLKILGGLFIIYMALFIANISGYYESKIRNKVMITEEGIKEFENKIQKGEEIDINSFLKNEREDFGSFVSKIGDGLTNSFENVVLKCFKMTKNILDSLF